VLHLKRAFVKGLSGAKTTQKMNAPGRLAGKLSNEVPLPLAKILDFPRFFGRRRDG
jgi:hypothetical protein